jgi:hypothetical protein
MTQYKNIPQPTDQRNISQGDILGNFQYLCTPLGTNPSVKGILPVDHFASADNVANPTDGFHKQVSFVNQSQQLAPLPANAINGQTANAALYTYTDGSRTELGYLTSQSNIQLTANRNPVAATAGQSYFPTVIGGSTILVQWGTVGQTSSSTVNVSFPTSFAAVPYNIQVTATKPGSVDTVAYYVIDSSIAAGGFSIKNNSGHTFGYMWIAIGPK